MLSIIPVSCISSITFVWFIDLATFIKQEEETNRVMKTYLENLGVFLFSSQVEKLQLAERYVVESSGAYVDTTSAITLVDIYCENITYDVLSPVLPYYVYQVEEEDEDAQDGGSIIPTNASTAATTSALTLSNKSTNNNNHHHHNNKARGGMTVIGPQGNNQVSSYSLH